MPLVLKCAEMDHFRINNNKKLFSVPFDKMMRWRGEELLDKIESIQLFDVQAPLTQIEVRLYFRVFCFPLKTLLDVRLPSLLTLNCVCWFHLVSEELFHSNKFKKTLKNCCKTDTCLMNRQIFQ